MRKEERVHIWPESQNDPDRPKAGWFAVKLGKGQPERALSVVCSLDHWFVYLDSRLVARQSDEWTKAFGRLFMERTMLIGRRLTRQEYELLCKLRNDEERHGIDLSKPINLNEAKAPF